MWVKWRQQRSPQSTAPADQWVREGDQKRDAGECLAAATAYQRAIQVNPTLTSVRVQLGNMLKDSGFAVEAVTAYREALTQGADPADTNLQLGRALRMLGRKGEAVSALTAGLKASPASPDLHKELVSLGESWDDPARPLPDVSPLAEIVGTLEEIKATIERIERQLPDATRFARIPLSRWDLHRRTWRVPPAPQASVKMGVLVLADPAPLPSVLAFIRSIEDQSSAPTHVAVVSADPDIRAAADARAGLTQIGWTSRGVDKALSLSSQAHNALRSDLSGCEWVVLADQPLLLEPQALGWLAHAAVQDGTEAVFCDEDIVHARAPGDPLRWVYQDPWLKDAADPELLDQGVPFGSLIAIRRDVLESVLAVPSGSEETLQTWWLHLHRALMERGGVRHGPNALASQFDTVAALRPASQDPAAGQMVRGGAGDAVLSVIIPTKDRLDLLRPCLESLRATAARPDRLSITIVDNGSSEPQTLAFLVQAQKDGTVQRVLRRDEPFNWSRLNNVAVAEGDELLLAFVNNDVEMISTGWDTALRWHLSRRDIGAVGARLLYPDRTVQHAGMVLGTDGSGAEHEGRGAAASDPGPRGRWKQRRTVPAVTGALLGCRRDAFEQVGGFDALRFGIWFSDVDFCLRLRAAGLRVIYEPAIEAYHHESKSVMSSYGDSVRGAYLADVDAMRQRG